ncbi:MAG: DUF4382 domain-containing protein [Candidatus Dadabacteria bacterium]
MKSIKTLLSLTLIASVLIFTSCAKNDSNSSNTNAHLQVYLTDQPGNYDVVNIDIQDVRINYSTDSGSGWQSLSGVKSGNYDLLRLANGRDTLLGDADVKAGRIEQIRLILGPNNFVKIGNQTYTLQTPSAQQSGLKLNIHQDVNGGVLYKLTLDFDASRSIVRTGNAGYILKPTIRTTIEAIGGALRGYVTPNNFATAVYALQGTDTVAGTYTSSGSYMIKGLSAGSYSLSFAPSDTTYKKQTKTGISITTGNVTVVDTVKLVH